MRKGFMFLLVMAMLLTLTVLAAGEEEEEISFADHNKTVVTPAPEGGEAQGNTEPAATPAPKLQPDGSVVITITAVGDVTIGRNVQHSGASIFEKELKKQNNDLNFIFRNVKDIFQADNLTIANFEGVLADTYTVPSSKRNNDYLFLAPVDYAQVFLDNGVEAVTMENNHVGDFGDDGITSTIAAMNDAGVVWSNYSNMGVYETQGVKIAMLSYQTLNQPFTSDQLAVKVAEDIRVARQTCDLVIVSFHWGDELDYAPQTNQVKLGRATIDAGADLVLGHHSHRINPIEYYNGKYIVYSLANCSFAGNNKPSDMFTYIFQLRLKIRNEEIVTSSFRIIPCRISSRTDYNDFAITPLTDKTHINTVINTLLANSKKLDYAVTSYPLEWDQ